MRLAVIPTTSGMVSAVIAEDEIFNETRVTRIKNVGCVHVKVLTENPSSYQVRVPTEPGLTIWTKSVQYG